MLGRSKLTYAEALRVLAQDNRRLARLDQILGGALVAAAPLTSGASLALLDLKDEVIGWIRDLTGTAPGRIKAASGRQHYELLEAAHTALALSAFFDALRDEVGPRYAELELTEPEQAGLAGVASPGQDSLPALLRSAALPMPSALRPFEVNLAAVREEFTRLLGATVRFLEGLAAWSRVRPDDEQFGGRVVERALGHYRERFVRLAVDLPEFGFWTGLDEHAATRDAVRRVEDALSDLERLLAQTSSPAEAQVRDVTEKLARQTARVLEQRTWRAEDQPPGCVFPTVRDGFVSPEFRLAVADRDARPAEESWWQDQPRRSDLATFLAHYLADPASAHRPLVILGHPGAGKSLLSEVIAARLPAATHTAILVRLRRVHADAEPHQQIEAAIESTVRERVSWGELCRESATTKVVILDGLDELIQASGVTQAGYLERISRFQETEWTDGHAVVPIVTSRTLVMDRVRVPEGTVLVKLEDFADPQVARWVEAWNRANRAEPSFRPLSPDRLLRHAELARQPLLLTLLAVYAAAGGVDDFDTAQLSSAELYRRLLDTFITRQVRDKAPAELGEAEQRRCEQELRRDLAVAAFGMFNRGQQYVAEAALDSDLAALAPDAGAGEPTGFGEPVGRARRVAAAFFFVHMAQSDQHDQAMARRTYEFLHATLGEYLIAEHTVTLLREVARERELRRDRMFARSLDDSILRALLAHQPLLKRWPIIEFLTELAATPAADRDGLRETALELLGNARGRGSVDGVEAYEPNLFDPVRRLAAYTANLVTLALAASPDGVPVADLSRHADWESTVRLWLAGLDYDGQAAVLSGLHRDEDTIVIDRDRPTHGLWIEAQTARLVGDLRTEAYLEAGGAAWGYASPATSFQRDFHTRLLGLRSNGAAIPPAYPGLDQLFEYQELLDMAARDELVATHSADLLLLALAVDGPALPPDLVKGLVDVAVKTLKEGDWVPILVLIELLARCPYLLDGRTQLMELIQPTDPWALAAARRLARQHLSGVPRRHRTTWEQLVTAVDAVSELPIVEPSLEVLTAEVVEDLASSPLADQEAVELVSALGYFSPVAWQQIRPGVVAELVGQLGRAEEVPLHVAEFIADYLAARGQTERPDGLDDALDRLASLERKETGQGLPTDPSRTGSPLPTASKGRRFSSGGNVEAGG